MKFSYAILSERGMKGFMEDTHIFEILSKKELLIFGGVYDGHKGAFAARYVKKHLLTFFLEAFSRRNDVLQALEDAYAQASIHLSHQFSGTTATSFYLVGGEKFFWAQAGDSSLIIVRNDGTAQQITPMHTFYNPLERERLLVHGGQFHDGFTMKSEHGIQPTRSLGDPYFRSIGIIDIPETGVYQIQPSDVWFLFSSDGLFGKYSLQELGIFFIRFKDAHSAIQALKKEVHNAEDNVTCILFKNPQLHSIF